MRFAPTYHSIAWTAVVTGVFSAIVGLGLVANFNGQHALLPLDNPQYLALKQQLESDAHDSALQQQLTEHDAQLRKKYFGRLRFARRGAYLLLAGLATTLLLLHWAAALRRRLPQPKSVQIHGNVTRQNQFGQLAAVVIVVIVTSLAISAKLTDRIGWPTSADLPQSWATNAFPDASERYGLVSAHVPAPDATPPVWSISEEPVTAEQLAANWPRFRGFQGSGISAIGDVPETWNGVTGEGVLWKTPVDLPGVSSPIVWEKRVFLTGASLERREVYCFDADTGRLLWRSAVATDEQVEVKVGPPTGHAAPTPATDGRRVYAIFASGHLVAFDFDGHELWKRTCGPLENHYGHATSLATYQDRLIVQLDQGARRGDKSKLLALRGSTGEVVWEVQRAVPASWATPIVVPHQDQWRIITCADPWVIAYAADDGREIWRASCLQGEVGPSPVYADGIVYVANDNASAAAIRDGGQGDVTESHVLWSARYSLPDICSPLVTDQHLLLVASYGALVAYDRQQGGDEPLWEEDLGTIPYASPSLVGDRVHLISEEGKSWIMELEETGVVRVAENELGERCYSSPAFQPGRIYLRGEQHLFCIGTQ